MADPYRKTQPGQPLSVSSRAWNRLLDGVHRKNVPTGQGFLIPTLPAVESFLSPDGAFVESRPPLPGEAVILTASSDNDARAATTPLAADMTLTTGEAALWAGHRLAYQSMYPAHGLNVAVDQTFAVCVDPQRSRFAMAGYAWVRVRALKGWHQFARRCLAQPGDSTTQLNAGVGCLDSCGWGPAAIVGWAPANTQPPAAMPLTTTQEAIATGAAGGIYWALVRF